MIMWERFLCRMCPNCGIYNDLSRKKCTDCKSNIEDMAITIVDESDIDIDNRGKFDFTIIPYVQKCEKCQTLNFSIEGQKIVEKCCRCNEKMTFVKRIPYIIDDENQINIQDDINNLEDSDEKLSKEECEIESDVLFWLKKIKMNSETILRLKKLNVDEEVLKSNLNYINDSIPKDSKKLINMTMTDNIDKEQNYEDNLELDENLEFEEGVTPIVYEIEEKNDDFLKENNQLDLTKEIERDENIFDNLESCILEENETVKAVLEDENNEELKEVNVDSRDEVEFIEMSNDEDSYKIESEDQEMLDKFKEELRNIINNS